VQIYTIIIDGTPGGASTAGVPFRPSLAAKPWDQARERQGPSMLEKLSEKTGGLHFHVGNDEAAKEAATKIGRALRDEYVIGYHAPQTGPLGKWHGVRVKTVVPKVNIYARSGYYSQ